MIASQVLRVAARDVRVEWSGREAVTIAVPLAAVTVLLAGLGFGPRPDVLAAVGPTLPWLVVLFAAVPLARGVAAAERAEGCWDLLRSLVPPTSLLAGKVLALWLWLAAVWLIATVLSVVLLNAPVAFAAVGAGLLGGLGVAAVTVMFGTLLAGLGFGPRPDVLAAVGPTLPWLVVLFAAVPLARGVAAAERAEGCWDLLRSLIPPASLLAGKVLALWLWLAAVWLIATVLSVVLLNTGGRLAAVGAGLLGTLGVAAATVIFGTLLAGVDGRSGLLAVLLFPAGLPALVAGGQAGAPGVAAVPWLAVLAAYDLITLSVAWALFPLVLED